MKKCVRADCRRQFGPEALLLQVVFQPFLKPNGSKMRAKIKPETRHQTRQKQDKIIKPDKIKPDKTQTRQQKHKNQTINALPFIYLN